MNLFVDTSTLYGKIEADIEEELLKSVEESKMEFKDSHSIVLYTALNKENLELLKKKKYQRYITAYEYPEYAMGTYQASVLVKIAYNTTGLWDT